MIFSVVQWWLRRSAMALATADHVVHHGRLVEFDSLSHRLEELLMLGNSGSW